MRRAPWPEAVGDVQKVCLENRLQDQLRCRLHDAVPHRGDAQRALPSIRLGDHLQPHRSRSVGLLRQALMQLRQKAVHAPGGVQHILDADAVHTRRTTVHGHLVPGRREHVWPRDPIVQCVESETRLLLRFDIQLLSQLEDLLRQSVAIVRKRGRQRHMLSLRHGSVLLTPCG